MNATTQALASASAAEPPPQLRASVLEAVHRTSQAGRAAAVQVTEAPVADAPAQETTEAVGGVRSTGAAPRNIGAAPSGGDTDTTVERLRRRYRRWLAATAGAALVPGALLGGWGATVQAQNAQDASQQREQQLLTASDVVTHQVTVRGETATLIASREHNAALLISSGLPDPGQSKEYQLWLMHDGSPGADAHFSADQPRTWLTGDVANADAVALTVEPEGGSTAPTSPVLDSVEV
uniref:anti-sigma factor n=1 Tax=Kocuria tytonis TaxID=2054280 RepID=UPI0018F5CA78|nr:anti-sigma factor [Kocuria tytonis]